MADFGDHFSHARFRSGRYIPVAHQSVVDLDAGSYVDERSFPLWAGALFLLSCATVVALRCTLLRIRYPVLFALATRGSNQSMKPTAGGCTERREDEL